MIESMCRSMLISAAWLAVTNTVSAQEVEKSASARRSQALMKSAGNPVYTLLNINNVTAWTRADGQSAHSPKADDGVYFPRGTGSVIYQDCLMWGGKVFTDPVFSQPGPRQLVRVGGGTYGIGTRVGRIIDPSLGPAWGSGIEDPSASDVRIYRIRRDYATMTDAEVRRDAAGVYEIPESDVSTDQVKAVRMQYHLDWTTWPVAKGAPYIDRNSNGQYEPPPAFNTDRSAGPIFTIDSLVAHGYDEPGIAGEEPFDPASQVIWTVYNDLTVSTALSFVDSEPMGLEVQRTYWAYNIPGSVSNAYFLRHRIINKGGVDTSTAAGDQFGAFWIDSMYVGWWSDPDVGNAGDDLVGCDTLLQLGFAFNASLTDEEFKAFILPPPAIAYTMITGPTVVSPGSNGMVGLRFRSDIRNLQMTSFTYYSSGPPIDECENYSCATGKWWKALRGYARLGDLSSPDEFVPYPPAVGPTLFPLSGDPVEGTGFLDGLGVSYSWAPGDRRMLMNSGPFRMAPGDTQDIVHAFVAGIGADNITSVAVLKFHAARLRQAALNGFRMDLGPTSPHVTAIPLDQEVVLRWDENLEAVMRTEDRLTAEAYRFEGYHVYQLPYADASINEGILIATFDRANGVTRIVDERIDTTSGVLTNYLAHLGSDSGVERTIRITRSRLSNSTEGALLYNGTEYYFAVTAYAVAVDPQAIPKSSESRPSLVAVRPQRSFGLEPQTRYGDTVAVSVASGNAAALVLPQVVDPRAGTGDTYELSFSGSPATAWSVMNVTDRRMVVSQQNLRIGIPQPLPEGGITLRFGSGPYGLQSSYEVIGQRHLTWLHADALGLESFGGAAGWESPAHLFGYAVERPVPPHRLRQVQIVFTAHDTSGPAAFRTSSDDTASYAYRFVANADQAAAQPSFASWIVNTDTGWSYQDHRISMPLAVYDIDASPPRRLAVGFVENNVAGGLVDGYYWPEVSSRLGVGDNTGPNGPREWLVVYDAPYTGAMRNTAWKNLLTDTTMPVMYLFTWNRRNIFPWTSGVRFRFEPYRVLSEADTLRFTIVAPATGASAITASLDRVGVYPNPYLGERMQATPSRRQFVTFINLPLRATIQVFNLAGHLVRTLRKDDASSFLEWDLLNEYGVYAGSGMYICRVDMPDLGVVRVLKLGVVITLE